MFMSFAPGF